MMTIFDFKKMKEARQKITMVTCYDHWTAQIVNQSQVDCVLVGDSLAMVMHGYPTTIQASVELMALHVAAVHRGIQNKFIIGDMPFPSFRKDLRAAMECVDALMKAGAHAVKLEGVTGHEEIVKHIILSGVPVMGHLGFTPQSIHQLGGAKVQGKTPDAAQWLMDQAKQLEDLGCFSVVLECVPSSVSKAISSKLSIPTIGIGAGPDTDGQVLVLQDLLGMNPKFQPKFLKSYLNGFELLKGALDRYNEEVKGGQFPSEKESYT